MSEKREMYASKHENTIFQKMFKILQTLSITLWKTPQPCCPPTSVFQGVNPILVPAYAPRCVCGGGSSGPVSLGVHLPPGGQASLTLRVTMCMFACVDACVSTRTASAVARSFSFDDCVSAIVSSCRVLSNGVLDQCSYQLI